MTRAVHAEQVGGASEWFGSGSGTAGRSSPGRSRWTFTLVAALAAVPADAGVRSWTALGPGGCAERTILAAPETGAAYALGCNDRLFRRDAARAPWHLIDDDFRGVSKDGRVLSLSFVAAAPHRLYVVTAASFANGVLRRSDDDGAHWVELANPSTKPLSGVAVDPARPATLYLFDQAKDVFRSADGGASWQHRGRVPTAYYPSGLQASPAVPDLVYATAFDGVFRSRDGGEQWQAVNSGLAHGGQGVRGLTVDPQRAERLWVWGDDGLFASEDGGDTWASINADLPAGSGLSAYDLEVASGDGEVLLASQKSGAFRSPDRGATWVRLGTAPESILSLTVDPADPQHILAATWLDGIWESKNGGGTWSDASGGFAGSAIKALLVQPTNPAVLIAASGTTIYRSADRGETWQRTIGANACTDADVLVASPTNPDRILAGNQCGLLESVDAGASWAEPGRLEQDVVDLAFDPQAPTTIWAATSSGVFRSTDDGLHWQARNHGLTGQSKLAKSLAIDPSVPTTLYLTTARDDVRSLNGGDSWEPIAVGSQSSKRFLFDAGSPAVLFADQRLALARSVDSGATWDVVLRHHLIEGLAVAEQSPGTVWATGRPANYGPNDPPEFPSVGRSHDGGITWEPVGDLGSLGGPGTLPVAPIALDPEEVGSAFVGTGAGVYAWDDRPACSSPRTLCIDQQAGDRRWRVTVSYASTRGGGTAGAAAALPLASLGIGRGGLFSFFARGNPEMLVKILDGCAANRHFWVFSSAGTDLGLSVTVLDTKTGTEKTYANPDHVAAEPIQDTSTFACAADDLAAADRAAPTGEPDALVTLPASSTALCVPSASELCVADRFRISVHYETTQGGGFAGNGHAVNLDALGVGRGGLFWFFGANNPEMLVKVLDGCGVNGHFWVFASAGTSVGLEVTIEDLVTGATRSYTNPDRNPARPVQDTSALPCQGD